ncbi:RusA family crossover junction endodeoxyribonuclease [Sedimentibacter hydroxybenzoicus DSM 7310]|uniref:RusA family crossover junction endodeoxyribonuclease n=1 Tax=Sedimentibacter hydroxybenzoicus DSM 7310 TaxID=1123245 RepID=A0A974BJ88_SEDHY|nr:RusA family crossover junction endodeoxyribonuclease [Sedimentibacter hydroxybenzoicus DSM 7310]
MKFTIPGEPKGKGRPKFSSKGKFVKAYTPETTVNYENWVKICFQEARQQMLTGQLHAELKCFYSIPKSFTKKKKKDASNCILRPTKKPDIDNICKIIFDSLNGLAYADDKDIVSCKVDKYYSDNPRVEVEIWMV